MDILRSSEEGASDAAALPAGSVPVEKVTTVFNLALVMERRSMLVPAERLQRLLLGQV